MMPNYTQFRDWMRDMASTLDEATFFDGFTQLSYIFWVNDGYIGCVELARDKMFVDCCKTVARLGSNFFDKELQIVYTSLHVSIYNYGLGYSDKHDKKKDCWEAWRDLIDY